MKIKNYLLERETMERGVVNYEVRNDFECNSMSDLDYMVRDYLSKAIDGEDLFRRKEDLLKIVGRNIGIEAIYEEYKRGQH